MANSVPYSFAWKSGSRFSSKLSPQRYGPLLMRCLKLYKQRLAAEKLLAEATPVNSVLHDAFSWDDASAAHQHRLAQARHLLRSLDYVFDAPDGELKGRATTITARNLEPGKYFYSILQPADVLRAAEQECGKSVEAIVKQLEHLLERCPQLLQGCTHLRTAIEQMKSVLPKPPSKIRVKIKTKTKDKVKIHRRP
jgi:hypothetical protein